MHADARRGAVPPAASATADAVWRCERRALVVALGALAVASTASAQPRGRPARIGWLSIVPYPQTPLWPVFVAGMRELGWVEGEHYVVEHRPSRGQADRVPALAAELAAIPVDVIVAAGTPLALAAKAATSTIPVLFFYVGDPVGSGLVASLGRPGGNVTGTGGLGPGQHAKALQLLHEAVPKAARIGLLINPDFPGHAMRAELEATAAALQLVLVPAAVRTPEDIEPAFEQIVRSGADAVFVVAQPFLFREAGRIARLANAHRLPSISPPEEFAESGALMAYGDRLLEHMRRLPGFVDRILKGARAADLPVEQSTRFYLTLNLKTAKAIGLALPAALLVRADRTID